MKNVSKHELLETILFLTSIFDFCEYSNEDIVDKYYNELKFLKTCKLVDCSDDDFLSEYVKNDK